MNAILDILVSLGVNKTVFVQIAVFLLAFSFLKYFVFSPYLAAYIERRKRTVGHADVAKEMGEEIQVIEEQYSKEAKALNDKIKVLFSDKRAAGAQESSKIIEKGYLEAQKTLVDGKRDIDTAYGAAREEMKTLVPDIGQAMVERLTQ